MLPKKNHLFIFFFFFSVSLSIPTTNPAETAALLVFKSASDRFNALSSWAQSPDPCSGLWAGVTCDPKTRKVTKLILDGLNLSGSIQPLTQLEQLNVLSLNHNLLSSSLNLSTSPHLNHLYLSHNNFTGQIPAEISDIRHLRRLDLSFNQLSGEIPLNALTKLPGLLTLRLESNSFTGNLDTPNASSVQFKEFNVSGNNLSGEIPPPLYKFDETSFVGNEQLCGRPLQKDCGPKPTAINPSEFPTDGSKGSTNSSNGLLIGIGVGLALLVVAGAFARWRQSKRCDGCGLTQKTTPKRTVNNNGYDYVKRHYGPREMNGVGARGPNGPIENEEMVVLEGCSPSVGKVGDLLKASAELLGMGAVGATYKIKMNGSDDVVAVKRLRERRVNGKDLYGWLTLIGEVKHINVVSLRAYHISNRELLLVYDFFPNGSLNSLLHGNRGPGRTRLDWSTRLKLASGAAQGLAFLHGCAKAKLFHGHLTSSNILVDQNGNACVADIGLQQILACPFSYSNAYTAPELMQPNPSKLSRKCDVYSFGVVLMEILTGRMSEEEGGVNLVEWVNEAVKKEYSAWDVFDFELLSDREMEEEMWALWQVGLLCLAALPKDRPAMNIVHNMIEDIRKKGIRKDGSRSIVDDISFDSSPRSP